MEEEIVECAVCSKEIDILHEPFEQVGDGVNETWYYHCHCYFEMRHHNGCLGEFLLH